MYRIEYTDDAIKDIKKLDKNVPSARKKLVALLEELKEHPRSGTGQVEQLKHLEEETWSRRIDRRHRLVYRIYEHKVIVLVVSAYGHYEE